MYEDLHVVVCVSNYRWIYGVKPTLIPLSNDADLLFTWQPALGQGAGYQRRWYTIYLTTSVQPGRWLPTTLIYYLLDNQRPARRWLPTTLIYYLLDNQRSAGALVTNDADLLFTWQPASGRALVTNDADLLFTSQPT